MENRIDQKRIQRPVLLQELQAGIRRVGNRSDKIKHMDVLYQCLTTFFLKIEEVDSEDTMGQMLIAASREIWWHVLRNKGKRNKQYRSPWKKQDCREERELITGYQQAIQRIRECAVSATNWRCFVEDMLYLRDCYWRQTLPLGAFRQQWVADMEALFLRILSLIDSEWRLDIEFLHQRDNLDHMFMPARVDSDSVAADFTMDESESDTRVIPLDWERVLQRKEILNDIQLAQWEEQDAVWQRLAIQSGFQREVVADIPILPIYISRYIQEKQQVSAAQTVQEEKSLQEVSELRWDDWGNKHSLRAVEYVMKVPAPAIVPTAESLSIDCLKDFSITREPWAIKRMLVEGKRRRR